MRASRSRPCAHAGDVLLLDVSDSFRGRVTTPFMRNQGGAADTSRRSLASKSAATGTRTVLRTALLQRALEPSVEAAEHERGDHLRRTVGDARSPRASWIPS